MESLIPDSVSNTLGQIFQTYADFEKLKLQNKIARAQAQAIGMSYADKYQNPQAMTDTVSVAGNTGLPMWAVLAIGAALVYFVVKA